MSKFIEVTSREEPRRKKQLININNIGSVIANDYLNVSSEKYPDKCKIFVSGDSECFYLVKESYEEIKKLIKEACDE